jgi:hypothetical protein
MIKKILPFAIFCMTLTSFPYQAPASEFFTDVPSSHWAAGTIAIMVDRGMVSGYGNGVFRPDSTVTRAEFAAMLVKATDLKIAEVNTPTYVDVLLSHWGQPQVEAARNYFNTIKTGEGLFFRPDAPILREEAAAALARAKELEEQKGWQDTLKGFKDYAEFNPEYGPDIAPALSAGLISGYGDGNFKPRSPLTRAEAAALIYRAFLYTESIQSWVTKSIVKPITETQDIFTGLTDTLNSQFGSIAVNLSPVKVTYYAREVAINGEESMLYVFGRIDPLKYFSFSDADYRTKPEAVKEFTSNTSLWIAKDNPGKKVLFMLGYANMIYYNPQSIFDSNYVVYLPSLEGWYINRFYAGSVALNNTVIDSWQAN